MSRKKTGPSMELKDGSDYIAKLQILRADIPDICGKAIYPAAGLVADAVKQATEALPAQERAKAGEDGRTGKSLGGIDEVQKQGLLEGLGIASMRQDGGYLNVKVGFDGYNGKVTERWPKGQPNAMIARSLERGTSFWQAKPFVKPTVKAVEQRAAQEMQKVLDEEIAKRMEGR